jgi:hypothetical protein
MTYSFLSFRPRNSLGTSAVKFVSIPQTVAARFSLDETFDVGEDTGNPVVEDYAAKIPYQFTGTGALNAFVVILEPQKLTEEERKQLLAAESKAPMGGK